MSNTFFKDTMNREYKTEPYLNRTTQSLISGKSIAEGILISNQEIVVLHADSIISLHDLFKFKVNVFKCSSFTK